MTCPVIKSDTALATFIERLSLDIKEPKVYTRYWQTKVTGLGYHCKWIENGFCHAVDCLGTVNGFDALVGFGQQVEAIY